MPAAKVLVGANVVLFVNGARIGRCTGFQWTSTENTAPIFCIDSTEALELVQGNALCSGTISCLRTIGDGGAEGMSLTTRYHDLPRQKYNELLLVERRSGNTLFQAKKAKLTNQSWAAHSQGVIAGTINFMSIEWNNEVAPAANNIPGSSLNDTNGLLP
jgi:hypothetical protein